MEDTPGQDPWRIHQARTHGGHTRSGGSMERHTGPGGPMEGQGHTSPGGPMEDTPGQEDPRRNTVGPAALMKHVLKSTDALLEPTR